jgi:hypothetical protein
MARNSLRARIEALEKRRGFHLPRPHTIVVRFRKVGEVTSEPGGYAPEGLVLFPGGARKEVSVAENGELINDPPKGGGE